MWENNAIIMTYNQGEDNKPASSLCMLGEFAREKEMRPFFFFFFKYRQFSPYSFYGFLNHLTHLLLEAFIC